MYRLIFKPLHLHLTMIDLVRLHLVIHVFAPIVFEHRGKIEGFFCSLKKYGCGNAIILLCSRVHHWVHFFVHFAQFYKYLTWWTLNSLTSFLKDLFESVGVLGTGELTLILSNGRSICLWVMSFIKVRYAYTVQMSDSCVLW